jgi:hypothetical protein
VLIIYCLRVLACNGAAYSCSIFDPQEAVRQGCHAELERVYGHEALSLSAVNKWRKQFVTGRIALEDDPRSGRPPRSELFESLWALIGETPFISYRSMCQKLRVPKTTCLRILHKDLVFRKCYLM